MYTKACSMLPRKGTFTEYYKDGTTRTLNGGVHSTCSDNAGLSLTSANAVLSLSCLVSAACDSASHETCFYDPQRRDVVGIHARRSTCREIMVCIVDIRNKRSLT
ncbi:uncharacterized protein PV07_07250 [Cladophialophora immunda]|uniref:Uncharacterized protein n=1 Tax=Cladophialophora immunda TaxID=569365 RepID=A0A0D2AR48_9EURO|nr:uncharacterized protein PV07_07250 [Cladophialophora immunda]KIW27517.1 hypothetical protein PV07_07250 [Cladophialophora immunda]